MIEMNKIYNTDCIGKKGMVLIPDNSIDMILCDLPYGTTQNKWDFIIDPIKMWVQYERIIKENGAIILTAAQPFTSLLVMSNLKLFRYDLTWDKVKISGFLNSSKMPLRQHEDILIFYKKLPVYNPQKIYAVNIKKPGKSKKTSSNYGNYKNDLKKSFDGERFPTSIISISNWNRVIFGSDYENGRSTHPTQKPVDLFRYLIKTYSNEGDTILDNCMGSGTTAIACLMENRNYIGFENDKEHDYYNKSLERIKQYQSQTKLF